jgi:hypothetical protein
MEFEHQKPVSDLYRQNWELTFGDLPTDEDDQQQDVTYENGCPVIEESNA